MFCKVIISDVHKIHEILQDMQKHGTDVLVVTQENVDSKFESGKVKSMLELFPEISEKSSEVIKTACDDLEKYKKKLEDIRYRGVSLYDLLEQYMLEDLIIIEKAKHILDEKRNTIFVFSALSFSCFSILKIAHEIGFDVNEGLQVEIRLDNKIKYVGIDDDHVLLEKSNQIKTAKKILKDSKIELAKTIAMQILIKSKKRISESSILHNIESKLERTGATSSAIFLLATDIDDFLIPYYRLLGKCEQEGMSTTTISVDLTTRQFLRNQKIKFVDLFDDVYLMHEAVRRSVEFEKICKSIEEISTGDEFVLNITRLSAFIKTRIIHVISIAIILEHILAKYTPKSMCIGIDGSTLANIGAVLAHKKKISTLSIEPGILNEKLERKNTYKADKICIYGKQGESVLINLGYQKERIFVTGNPRYDQIKEDNSEKIIDILHKEYGIKKDAKKILIAMSRWHHGDAAWMSKMINALNNTNNEIILKIHPIYMTQNTDLSDKMLAEIKEKTKGKFHIIFDINSSQLLSAVNLVITDYSNVGVEAMLRNIPVITVNFANEDTRFMQKFHETKSAMLANTVEELIKITEDIITGKYKRDSQNTVSDLFNYKNDGNATDRTYQLLVQGD